MGKCNDEVLMIDTETCPIHIVHDAYKTAIENYGWLDMITFFKSAYNLFKNFPTRISSFTLHTNSKVFLLKFCTIQWVENSRVLQRMIDVLPHLRKYIEAVKGDPPPPDTRSNNFVKVKRALKNPVINSQLCFLLSITNDLEDFLTSFQGEKPMFPFLYKQLFVLLRNIGERFIEKKVV